MQELQRLVHLGHLASSTASINCNASATKRHMSTKETGVETYYDWLRGPIYHFSFARDESNRSNQVSVNNHFCQPYQRPGNRHRRHWTCESIPSVSFSAAPSDNDRSRLHCSGNCAQQL